MEVWLSAEVHNDVARALRQASNVIRNTVISKLTGDYGPNIRTWALITILRPRIPDGWGEVCQYHRRDRTAEFRLIIDYVGFKTASSLKQSQMLMNSILRSVDFFPRLNVNAFDTNRFRSDLIRAATAAGLLVDPAQ